MISANANSTDKFTKQILSSFEMHKQQLICCDCDLQRQPSKGRHRRRQSPSSLISKRRDSRRIRTTSVLKQKSLLSSIIASLILIKIITFLATSTTANLVSAVHRGRRHDLIKSTHNEAQHMIWGQQFSASNLLMPNQHHHSLKTSSNTTSISQHQSSPPASPPKLSSNDELSLLNLQQKRTTMLKENGNNNNNILSQEHVIFDEASRYHQRRHRLTENLMHYQQQQQQRGEGKSVVLKINFILFLSKLTFLW